MAASASFEHLLVSAILHCGSVEYAMERATKASWFSDPDQASVLSFVFDHSSAYGKVPDLSAIQKAYPNWSPVPAEDIPERVEYYVDVVRDDYLKRSVMARMTEVFGDAEEYMTGADGGERLWADLADIITATRMEVPVGGDDDLYGNALTHLLPLLKLRAATGAIPGIPTGFPSFDISTGGLQKERLFILIGLPKSGKSSVALRIALNASMAACRTLFVTFEMTNEEQRDRSASLLTGLDVNHIIRGTVLPKEREFLESELRKLEGLSGFFTLVEDRSSTTTIDGLQAKIAKYNPGLVVVDGAYMMEDQHGEPPGSPRAITNISRGLKRLAQNNDTCILVTTQALHHKSKGGLNENSAGYSSSWGQDADVLFGVEHTPTPNYSKLMTLLSRTGPPSESYIQVEWSSGTIQEVPLALVPSPPTEVPGVSKGGF